MHETFRKVARKASEVMGSSKAFIMALSVVAFWAITGPLFHYSDSWQLFINTGTTILTFLMVFLIQNTQNHDAKAIHLKLDELIKSIDTARNSFIDVEEGTDEELHELEHEFEEFKKNQKKK
jgi:low affinity Fe/Cu permease